MLVFKEIGEKLWLCDSKRLDDVFWLTYDMLDLLGCFYKIKSWDAAVGLDIMYGIIIDHKRGVSYRSDIIFGCAEYIYIRNVVPMDGIWVLNLVSDFSFNYYMAVEPLQLRCIAYAHGDERGGDMKLLSRAMAAYGKLLLGI